MGTQIAGTKHGLYAFSELGGDLSLDFVNTMGSRNPDHPDDHLGDYNDLVRWAIQLGVLAEGERLLKEAKRRPQEAEATLVRAKRLREAIYALFSPNAAGRYVVENELATLNTELARALSHLQLTREGGSYRWTWRASDTDLDRMLWPVAKSAAELRVGDEEKLARLRECAGETCGWLFLDMSRNHSRHWCDMRDCGNRAKAQRHYRKKQGVMSDE